MNPRHTTFGMMGALLLTACTPEKAQLPEQVEYLPPTSPPTPTPESSPPAKARPPDPIQPGDVNSFTNETVGAQPTSFTPAVGNWVIGIDGDNQVLVVDGRPWQKGQPATGIAEQAKALYGDRYAEFLDNVQAFAYFPFAVDLATDDFQAGEINVRFKAIDGRIDQAAGILFNLKQNGDYLVVRANPLEENMVLFQYVKGKRSAVKWIRNTPTPTQTWHDLKLVVAGQNIQGYLNDKLYLEHTLPAPVSGRVGLWSKADSVVYLDDFYVKPKPQ